ncbi:hypothetical protein EBU71_06215 [bacterium]|nr:hypothetical protein [Candidatus Elulimicrobium humile]
MSTVTASINEQFRAVMRPLQEQMKPLVETLARAAKAIAESPYVRDKVRKARLVAFLLGLLVRARRATLTDAPTSGGVAFDAQTFTSEGPPTLAPVLSTHQGSNSPNVAPSFLTRRATSRVSGRKALTHEMR